MRLLGESALSAERNKKSGQRTGAQLQDASLDHHSELLPTKEKRCSTAEATEVVAAEGCCTVTIPTVTVNDAATALFACVGGFDGAGGAAADRVLSPASATS